MHTAISSHRIARHFHSAPYIIIALTFAIMMLGGCSDLLGADDSEQPAAKPPVPVTTAPVRNLTDNLLLEMTGTVRYLHETPLAFTTTGKIASVTYQSGDRVRRGALMAALDTTSVDAELTAARAELDRADAELGRFTQLFEKGWVTRAQLDQVEAAQKSAKARVSAAEFATGTSRIFAPSSGIVLSRDAEPGQVLAAGTPVLILGEDRDGLVLRTPVTDAEVTQLSVGMRSEIDIIALGGETFEAQIRDIDGRADPATGAFTVSFALPEDSRLRSGQIGKVRIPVASDDAAPKLTIPAPAVFDVRTGEALVYIVNPKDNSAGIRSLRIGEVLDDRITVLSGLNGDEQIIVTGHEKVRPGDIVAPQSKPAKSAAPAGKGIETLQQRADAQSKSAPASSE